MFSIWIQQFDLNTLFFYSLQKGLSFLSWINDKYRCFFFATIGMYGFNDIT